MNWRSDGRDSMIVFEELKIGMTFFFCGVPYLKVSGARAFNIDENYLDSFDENDPIEPCTHELILNR